MSCSHSWQKINDVFICTRCGFTRLPRGNVLFDRHLPNYKRKKVKDNAHKK